MAGGGQPGNKNAAKGALWQQAILRVVAKRPKDLEEAATALLDAAKGGDVAALKELGDRLDGKAKQSIAVSADTTVEDGLSEFNSWLTATLAGQAAYLHSGVGEGGSVVPASVPPETH